MPAEDEMVGHSESAERITERSEHRSLKMGINTPVRLVILYCGYCVRYFSSRKHQPSCSPDFYRIHSMATYFVPVDIAPIRAHKQAVRSFSYPLLCTPQKSLSLVLCRSPHVCILACRNTLKLSCKKKKTVVNLRYGQGSHYSDLSGRLLSRVRFLTQRG